MLSRLVLLAVVAAAVVADSSENANVDKVLEAILSKAEVQTVADHVVGFTRKVGPINYKITMLFWDGKMNLAGLERTGEAKGTDDGKVAFKARLEVVTDLSYKVNLVGADQALSTGKTRNSWTNDVYVQIAVDGCKVALDKLLITSKKFDMDVQPNGDDKSATVHPPPTNDFEKALMPKLTEYFKGTFQDITVC